MLFNKWDELKTGFNIPVYVHGINNVIKTIFQNDADDLLIPPKMTVSLTDSSDIFYAKHLN